MLGNVTISLEELERLETEYCMCKSNNNEWSDQLSTAQHSNAVFSERLQMMVTAKKKILTYTQKFKEDYKSVVCNTDLSLKSSDVEGLKIRFLEFENLELQISEIISDQKNILTQVRNHEANSIAANSLSSLEDVDMREKLEDYNNNQLHANNQLQEIERQLAQKELSAENINAGEYVKIDNDVKDLYSKISTLEIEKEKLLAQIRNQGFKENDKKVITQRERRILELENQIQEKQKKVSGFKVFSNIKILNQKANHLQLLYGS